MNKKTIQKKRIEDKRALTVGEENRLNELAKSLEELEAYAYVKPRPMLRSIYDGNEEAEKIIDMTLSAMFRNLSIDKKRELLLNRILSEIILGAYQDRMVAYATNLTGTTSGSIEAMETMLRIRHKTDNHLIRVIQAFKDIKRPPVNIVVKQADQVNVGEKQMNVDKQVNVSSDLDKK